jgi:hypothetical protein
LTLGSDELREIIKGWDTGDGFTAAVRRFAAALPMGEREVWNWLSGKRGIKPIVAERIRSLPSPASAKTPRP